MIQDTTTKTFTRIQLKLFATTQKEKLQSQNKRGKNVLVLSKSKKNSPTLSLLSFHPSTLKTPTSNYGKSPGNQRIAISTDVNLCFTLLPLAQNDKTSSSIAWQTKNQRKKKVIKLAFKKSFNLSSLLLFLHLRRIGPQLVPTRPTRRLADAKKSRRD